MVLTDQQLLSWVNSFMLPFIRFSAFFLAAPFFGTTLVPVRVRIVLALAATIAMQGSLQGLSGVDVFSLQGLLHVLQQILVGLTLGFVFQLVMTAITLAGHNVATTMGLGFAASADPQNGSESTTIGQIYTVIATLYFLSVDAHLHLLSILVDSMKGIPLQKFVLDASFFRAIVHFSAQIFVFGTLLVLPVIVGLLLVNLALAVMTRAAPQLNIFSLGFPVTIITGFVLMLLSLPVLSPLLASFMDVTLAFMQDLARG